MAHPGHEIVVQDITQIQSSRADIMNKCDFKPKPFIFKGYKTEADRIVKLLIINFIIERHNKK